MFGSAESRLSLVSHCRQWTTAYLFNRNWVVYSLALLLFGSFRIWLSLLRWVFDMFPALLAHHGHISELYFSGLASGLRDVAFLGIVCTGS